MPFVRIFMPAGEPADVARALGGAVHDAMIETINVPSADHFQVITQHEPAYLVTDAGYLGVQRTARSLIIAITMKRGRTPAMKRALYRAIRDNVCSRTSFRQEDILTILSENDPIDWSFGNGEAQIAPLEDERESGD